MPKIFSNISQAQGLQKVYTSSSLNQQESPFGNIRKLATPNGPIAVNIANTDIRRIEPVYRLFTDRNKSFVRFADNKLRISATVQKINRATDTTIYDRFSTNNPYIVSQKQTLPENGTLIEIKPYSKDVAEQSFMRQDSQTLPLISGPRDEKRLINYMKSSEGLLFLARQQILQAGNTFKQSRRYNPASVVLAASKYALSSLTNPLERVDRALSLDSQSTSKTIPQMIDVSDIAGRVQQETVLSKQGQLRLRFVGGQTNGSNRKTAIGQIVGTAASRLIQSVVNRTNIGLFGKKINLGQLGRTIGNLGQTVSAINRGLNIGDATITKDQTAYDALIQADLWPLVKNKEGTIQNFHINKKNYIERAQKSLNAIKLRGKLHNNFFTKPYPSIEEDYRSSDSYTDDVQTEVGSFNGVTSARYMQDPMNMTIENTKITNLTEVDKKYDSTDFIKFKITIPTVFEGLYFRAFIQDLKHDAKGEYEEQRYVGRPEKFMVYKGMSRSLKFTAYLVAFTEEELSSVWLRANMLTKLVYPINSMAGHMVPPIARLTIGNIIEDQPGYFTNVDMDFSELPWDIDSEVTQIIKVDIGFNIIEKNFITQAQTNGAISRMDLFANSLSGVNKAIDTPIPIPNIDLPQVNLSRDPVSQTELRTELQSISTRLEQRAVAKEGFQGLVQFAKNGSSGIG